MLEAIIKSLVRRLSANVNASIVATNHRVGIVEAKANSTDDKLTAIMDGYPQNAENLGRCIGTMGQELGRLNTRYEELYQELQTLKATVNCSPTPVPDINLDLGYAVNVLFLGPMEDQYAVPLKGIIENYPYDYTLECEGSDGLTVVQSLPTLSFGMQPSFINLEVRGEGTLIVKIRQTIIVDGHTTMTIQPFCNVVIKRGQTEYGVASTTCWPISMLLQSALINRPIINYDN